MHVVFRYRTFPCPRLAIGLLPSDTHPGTSSFTSTFLSLFHSRHSSFSLDCPPPLIYLQSLISLRFRSRSKPQLRLNTHSRRPTSTSTLDGTRQPRDYRTYFSSCIGYPIRTYIGLSSNSSTTLLALTPISPLPQAFHRVAVTHCCIPTSCTDTAEKKVTPSIVIRSPDSGIRVSCTICTLELRIWDRNYSPNSLATTRYTESATGMQLPQL